MVIFVSLEFSLLKLVWLLSYFDANNEVFFLKFCIIDDNNEVTCTDHDLSIVTQFKKCAVDVLGENEVEIELSSTKQHCFDFLNMETKDLCCEQINKDGFDIGKWVNDWYSSRVNDSMLLKSNF